jgi:hypothetical protein
MTDTRLRGQAAISVIADMLRRYINDLKPIKSPDFPIHLYATDFDMVQRWPRAGALFGFIYNTNGEIWFEGWRIVRAAGQPTYGSSRF